jgi:hypothetical protein
MATFKITKDDFVVLKKEKGPVKLLKKEKFDSFNQDILGLGEIETKSKQVNALSVIFDLEGFTNFCKQIDPQLAVPEFLSEFLGWLFGRVKMELIENSYPEGYRTYADPPFLSKFMGDGVLFLWDTEEISETEIQNIVVSMKYICDDYKKDFLPRMKDKITTPPSKLRCGIARGAIYSVGNGNDFVGPCINMSARLQKLNSLTFCFSRRGINTSTNEWFAENITTMSTDIRGIGASELVCMLTEEYKALPKFDKDKFVKP